MQAILPETSPFLSAQMAMLCSFFQMFIVLGMYNFASNMYFSPNVLCELYSCKKVTFTWVQISCKNWFGFFSSNVSHQMIIWLTPIVSRSRCKLYKHQKIKKLALNLWLQTYQILTNNVQMIIFCVSYFITTVKTLGKNPFNAKLQFVAGQEGKMKIGKCSHCKLIIAKSVSK